MEGILVPLITPFAADGSLAADALAALADDVLTQGASGLVALGTTGEPFALDADEKQTVLDVCAQACAEHGATLVVGAGGSDTASSAAALAAHPRADAALVPVPYYVRPGEAGVIAHYARLAADSPVPLLVYHVPHRTAQPLSPATLLTLSRLPNVVGAKIASGMTEDAITLLGDCPENFAVLAGDDAYLSPMLALGARGGITASAHLCTDQFAQLVSAWHKGDAATARPLGHALNRLSTALFAEPNPTVLKGVLHAQGRIPTPDVRLPMVPASARTVAAVLTLVCP
ncbi:dihydrodipicolinate synthase family protein [Kutzneria buriramensis]|uniref:4-hydroxy-tetrahydrodipicolinate synthase n=1 Tax=Kutzneria buriramensis TaxID=1045776 RepID=A0A3E0HL64_9PSEU|nr:dihydrodipicolinate synthase family protein [Kutzneria buriramensis]REH47223.1 4-hydroxy-tetrahydrodipicolinate synthase [Kutzneria buriramensis]